MFQKKKAVPIKLPQIEFADIRQSETFFFQKKLINFTGGYNSNWTLFL